ncbi:hypothetical protein BJ165DRAFT_1514797 [Panaeolus papilionaceus]|nr:hypothetical protein BJ165DRAFT_1514797 [Panaeolus papilionaceus]
MYPLRNDWRSQVLILYGRVVRVCLLVFVSNVLMLSRRLPDPTCFLCTIIGTRGTTLLLPSSGSFLNFYFSFRPWSRNSFSVA